MQQEMKQKNKIPGPRSGCMEGFAGWTEGLRFAGEFFPLECVSSSRVDLQAEIFHSHRAGRAWQCHPREFGTSSTLGAGDPQHSWNLGECSCPVKAPGKPGMLGEKKWIDELPGKGWTRLSFPSPAHLIAFPPSHAQGISIV